MLAPINTGIAITAKEQRIQNALDNIRSDVSTTCYSCRKFITMDRIYGSHVFIDLSIVTDTNYDEIDSKRIPFNLRTIDASIEIQNNSYILVGTINYIPYITEKNNGHYTTFIFNGETWHQYDDLDQSRTMSNGNQIIIPHLLLYVRT